MTYTASIKQIVDVSDGSADYTCPVDGSVNVALDRQQQVRVFRQVVLPLLQ
jgi:hypothetical protein